MTDIDFPAALAGIVEKFGERAMPEWLTVVFMKRSDRWLAKIGSVVHGADAAACAWMGWLVQRLGLDVGIREHEDWFALFPWQADSAPGLGDTFLAACLDLLARWPADAKGKAVDNPFNSKEKP